MASHVLKLNVAPCDILRGNSTSVYHHTTTAKTLIVNLHVQALKEALHTCLSHQGQGLVQALALALLQTCPRHLLRSLAAPLRALLEDSTMSDAVKSTFSQMVCSQQYIGNAIFICVVMLLDTSAWPKLHSEIVHRKTLAKPHTSGCPWGIMALIYSCFLRGRREEEGIYLWLVLHSSCSPCSEVHHFH